MPKYLFEAKYTLEGIRTVAAKGGSARKSAVAAAAKSLGGRLESFYFAFGETDVHVIADLPGNEAAAALALTVCAGGGASVRTTVLLEPREMDAAAKQQVAYQPPVS